MPNVITSILNAVKFYLQSNKTVTPTTSTQTVTPDTGYDCLQQVTVNPIPSEYVIPTNITPSNSSPVTLSSGSSYKMNDSGKAVYSITSITPSDTSSESLDTNFIYKPSYQGYAVESSPIQATPPSTPSFMQPGLYNIKGPCYISTTLPQPMSETTLWTNSSPTTSMSATTVSLTQGKLSDFSYIKVQYAKTTSKTSEVQLSVIVPYSDFLHTVTTEDSGRMRYVLYYYSTFRYFYYDTDTTISFTTAASSGTAYPSYCIPTKISGLK